MSQAKVLSEKSILRTDFIEVVESQIEKDGKIHVHTNVFASNDVFVIPLTEEHEVYLISQYRYMLGKEKLEAVAGVIDKGEDPETAARRELKEEAGLIAGKLTKIATFERGASFIRGQWHVFVAQDLQETEKDPDELEDITVVKLPLAEAIKKIEEGEINTTGGVSALLLTNQLLSEGKLL